MKRRAFLKSAAALPLLRPIKPAERRVQTVMGTIPATEMGMTLIHEHILVDFIGADKINSRTWNRKTVRESVAPYLKAARQKGVQTLLDCTPNFLGRDVVLLREIAQDCGLHIITNTGYYGAVDNKYLPTWAFTETDEQLAARWIQEFENGIDGTSIRPGFIKIGVNPGPLSEIHQKLVRAAAITHLATGLTICSHTGPAVPAFQELAILRQMGVGGNAFVWVHAQNEPDKKLYTTAAQKEVWVSLDGLGWGKPEEYADWLGAMKTHHVLHKVLVSHDAGWYRPGETDPMEKFVGFTQVFDKLIPLLKGKGFSEKNFDQLLRKNPAEAFGIGVRKI